ncbi:MAG: TIGR00341 family protein [Acidimicrobiales bacterium]
MTETSAATTPPDDADTAAPKPDLPRRWSERRRGMDPENRRRVLEACAIRTSSGWVTHFVLMMVLSVIVAVMGLSADSAALVIGAMLLAPLMQPVLGTAAALTMAMMGQLRRSLVVLLLASVGSILLATVVAAMLGNGSLSGEVLARTSPDARDLVVALAAGAAGAYAISRPDLSSSLPGVAIAVALVPPLGVVGMTLEAGRTDLAGGALLLYVTNLVAIVASGVLVFLLTGFAPPRRLATTSTRVVAGGLLTVALMVAVAVPLTLASVDASSDARDRENIESAVRAWISITGDEIDEVDIDGSSVIVRVFGFESPPPTGPLQQRVQQILGPDATVEVRWTQAQLAPTDTVEPTEEELLTAEVGEVARQWLEAAEIGAYELRVAEVSNDFVLVDVTSASALPTVEDLQARLRDATGLAPEVEVRWTEQRRLLPDDGTETIDETTARLERVARDWALEQPDLSIVRVGYDGVTITVDLIGVTPPDGPALERLLLEELDAEADVRIWFSERSQLVPVPTPTPTPVPTPTPTPVPTPTPEPEPERQRPARATPTPGG